MAEPFVGQIVSFAFSWAPLGWFPCDGRKLPISGYEALYAVIGTIYGGNGQTDFALPNLNGRVPLGIGQGPGRSSYLPGQALGSESISLLSANIPAHNHAMAFSGKTATDISPKQQATGQMAVAVGAPDPLKGLYASATAAVSLMPGSITYTTGSQPHENRQQFLTLNYVISWAGIFPSRN